MEKRTSLSVYVFRGVIIGLFFPVFSVFLCLFFLTERSSNNLLTIHQDFPLLSVIDSAPLVLGLISYIVGSRIERSNENYIEEITVINETLRKKNLELSQLVSEKNILFKEIHHRVKNNLQVITSLLSLQASFIDNDEVKGLFRYSQYRINSMAVVHEMLYKSEDISQINFSEYIEKLVNGLIYSMKGSVNKISLKLQIPDISLNIDTSIPLGLLINEIVTNSLKYGIIAKEPGVIDIKMLKHDKNNFVLYIGDDGVGFPSDINWRNSNTLGLLLMHKLTLQLKGNIEKDNSKKGTNYIVNFQEIHQIS
jgi:two-component sensor histidine kinase